MAGEVLARVTGVSKKFCLSLKRSLWYGLQDIAAELSPFLRRAAGGSDPRNPAGHAPALLRPGEFWAVDDVSFELRRGECLGLLGRNGAGKTTLLKMLNGLIKPDGGRIELRGRVSALIALGAGFNPVLTGRENIHVNGSVLGLTGREIEHKIDDIIDFAELREFIDAPVQSYSSGMHVRLGFAIASALDPDVLLLDEVLAVGDIGFTIKCLNRMRAVAPTAAVIFVSHNMQFISSFCTRVLVMDRGRTVLDAADPAQGIDRYYASIEHEKLASGTGEAELLDFSLAADGHDELAQPEPRLAQGTSAHADLSVRVAGGRNGAQLSLYIHDDALSPVVCVPVVDDTGNPLTLRPGDWRVRIPLGPLELNAGKYSFVLAVRDDHSMVALCRVQGILPFRIFASQSYWGKVVRPSRAHVTALPNDQK
jgi:lipopolysaccharide transport system ATP-binding protein